MRKRLSTGLTYKKTFLFSAACCILSIILIVLSRTMDGFAQWYAVNVYPVFPYTLGKVFSVLNFSFFEAGLLIFSILTAMIILAGLSMLIMKKPFIKSKLSRCFQIFTCFTASMILVYTLTCAINYSRDSIGTVLNLPGQDASEEKLVKLSLILAEELNRLTENPEWDYSLLAVESAAYIETEAVNAMKMLGKREPSLAGYYPAPKPVHFSRSLSSLGIEGIFSPFTMEANYNNDLTSFLIPYTICHELAHLKGYMKEEDAGFIAFLASRNSPSLIFQYSGFFHALDFSLNALNTEASAAEYKEIYKKLPEPIRAQINYVKSERQKRTSSLTSTSRKVNHLYLKANAQSGTKSYGRIVDLLISDYAEMIQGEDLL